MIIVAGALYLVDAASRDDQLVGFHQLVIQARKSAGCVDFYVAADPIEENRLNVYELWDSVDAVEAFRASVQPGDQSDEAIAQTDIYQYEISSSTKR